MILDVQTQTGAAVRTDGSAPLTTRSAADDQYLHALCAARTQISALRLLSLVRTFKPLEQAWHARADQLRSLNWSDEVIATFQRHRSAWNVEAEHARLRQSAIGLLPLTDNRYPSLLRDIYDPPLGLYVRGEVRADDVRVAVVGSRRATPYGRTVTQALVRPLAARGLTIVSGLAYGIDAEAHRATLAVGGRTIAVLGGGLDAPSLYPRAHRGLAEEITAAGGALLSEYPPGTPPRAEYFPQRNRIIAGLARAVIVTEAARESGALITARLALDGGREVLVVPGPITSAQSEGANRLLRDGAAPALSADDILEALALDEVLTFPSPAPTARPAPAVPEPAADLLRLLSSEPKSIDALVLLSKLPAHEVAAALSLLELDGRIRDVGGKQYVRC